MPPWPADGASRPAAWPANPAVPCADAFVEAVRPSSAPASGAPANPADFAEDATFDRVAMRVHAAQRAASPVLRRYWETAAGPPSTWRDVPPVPTAAFKDLPICAGGAEAVFRTSGTSGGRERRGEHHVASLELYRAAARGAYRTALFEGAGALRLIALVPSPAQAADSSLGRMAGFLAQEPEVTRAWWAFDPARGVRAEAVREALADDGAPALLVATAFSLVHLLDALMGARLPFPPGSRVMETGGFKGRATRVDRSALYARVARSLNVAPADVVNEYGMTELLSQSYDGVAGRAAPVEDRVHRFPPWVRVRALDPVSLRPLSSGETGLLSIFDLANAGSACPVLTEDLGAVEADGNFTLRGRATAAEARGCSLAAESFLRAVAPRSA